MKACKLCETNGGSLIWSGRDCRIVQIDDPDLPGFCRVIWREHVAEMSDLSRADRTQLMQIVFGVEEIVASCMRPDKINLASLGNQVPHLHWHIVPRFTDDMFFPDSIWSANRRDVDEQTIAARRLLANAIPGAIRAEVGSWLAS